MGVRIPPPLPIPRSGASRDDGSEVSIVGFVTRAQEFVKEVLIEFRKVTWPSRQELLNSTAVVIVVTVVLAFFLGGVDIGLARIVERILR
jgi:preprotein translocase subunit SecE